MGRKKEFTYYVADFETSVYSGQTETEVWAAALVPVGREYGKKDVVLFNSIEAFFNGIKALKRNAIIYFHNLKFDGTFIIDALKRTNMLDFVQRTKDGYGIKPKRLKCSGYMYAISDKGQWYTITIQYGPYTYELRDSLKLLPFSVKAIGKGFETEHRKSTIEYTGERHAGYVMTDDEADYIKNDVLVVKEALEIMFEEGHTNLTIGSCCLEEWKRTVIEDCTFNDKEDIDKFFPNLYEQKLAETYGAETTGEYIRNAYKGGWCYVVPEKANIHYKEAGTTADVNSLYPSVMHSESGCKYPVGSPIFFKGGFPDNVEKNDSLFYYVRVKMRFTIKKNHLPCIQIKGDKYYKGNEWLTTSDYVDKSGMHWKTITEDDGTIREMRPTLTLTKTDWELIQDQYDIYDLEILDGCWFHTIEGVFDSYINKYRDIKMNSKGARRQLAKLFLNNLYGKFATAPDADFRKAWMNPDTGSIIYETLPSPEGKKPGYIAIGAAITSYARNFTIRAAQANYYGPKERGFVYADTDSIHCTLKPEEMKAIRVHPTAFCCWKLETCWDEAIFVRQKTYVERVVAEDTEPIDKPYYNVKAAGMPAGCQELLSRSLEGLGPDPEKEYTKEQVAFVSKKRSLKEFKVGLEIPGSLKAKVIKGGTILKELPYKMR